MAETERILVVDDALTMRQLLKFMLEEAQYQVDVAATAGEAIEAIKTTSYDLLIVDKNLDADDGFALCRAAREICPTAARIVMTADHSMESAIQAVEEDIFAYLMKPLRKQAVLLRVRRALDRVRLTRKWEEARAEMQAAKEALEKRTEELEQTLSQLLRTQARLAESEKLVSVGMLAAGVAHEINNPACFILPNLAYVKRAANTLGQLACAAGAAQGTVQDEVDHVHRMIDRSQEGLARIQKVVSTLLLFSRREPAGPEPVDLNALCLSLLELVTHELGDRAQLEVDLQPIPVVQGQQKELAQAVLNLLLNARRSVFAAAKSKEHKIWLRTKLENDQIALTVSDTGPPLDPDQTGQALDPFFFGSGAVDQGPGLSLSLVRDILDRHRGRLVLHSNKEGNCLEAFLPVVAK